MTDEYPPFRLEIGGQVTVPDSGEADAIGSGGLSDPVLRTVQR